MEFCMQSSRILLLLAVTVVSSVNALVMCSPNPENNPNVIELEQFMSGNFVNEKQQSWAHILAIHCNNPDVELRVKPFAIMEKLVVDLPARYPGMSPEEVFAAYMVLSLGQDAEGMTPFDILEKQECKTVLCHYLKEEFLREMQQQEQEQIAEVEQITVIIVE